MSTHSPEILQDGGIGLNEVFVLTPTTDGTTVEAAKAFPEVRTLVEAGDDLADAIFPFTKPQGAEKLQKIFDS